MRTWMKVVAATAVMIGSTAVASVVAHADPVPAAGPVATGAPSAGSVRAPSKPEQVTGADDVAPLAVVNLGLSSTRAMFVQCWLRTYWGYTGGIDGELGPNSWKAFQRNLREHWGYTGGIDGDVGSGTVSALQRLLSAHWGYTGPIDGQAGSGTQAAFQRFADACSGLC
ncbi:peptidoglycan-binding domain-containing protein [Lentzea sp. NPDC059081]|uniref:peptidoglycan-binding domain-containing protein n=1 Tax=Lentzea sp. NPDC059081 TaxID=3346719 RepID=UPI0036BCD4E7